MVVGNHGVDDFARVQLPLSSSDKRSTDPWIHSVVGANDGNCGRHYITVWALGSSPRVTTERELIAVLTPDQGYRNACIVEPESNDGRKRTPHCHPRTSAALIRGTIR